MGAVVLTLLAAASWSAARVAWESSVTIKWDDAGEVETLRGKVRSLQPLCKPRRKVLIYGDDSQTKEAAFFLLATDRTDRAGRWYASRENGAPIKAGRYFARVKAKEVAGGRCLADRSRTIEVAR